jgi:transcriptional regulator with XRE-family HTH domain
LTFSYYTFTIGRVGKYRTISRFKTLDLSQRRIGYRLAFVRKCNDVTQKRCALLLGLTVSQIANIEAGRVSLKTHAAWRICDVLWIHPTWLAVGNEPMGRADLDEEEWESFERDSRASKQIPYSNFWLKIVASGRYPQMVGHREPAPVRPLTNQKMEICKVLLDNNPDLPDAGGVKEIRSQSELLDRIRRQTKQRGQKVDLARFVGVSRQAVNQWLRGTTKPSAEATFKVMEWLHGPEGKNKL